MLQANMLPFTDELFIRDNLLMDKGGNKDMMAKAPEDKNDIRSTKKTP